jgi:hypothetical protein
VKELRKRKFHRSLLDMLFNLKIQCPKEGCEYRATYEQVFKHLNTECQDVMISCPFDCEEIFVRKNLEEHLKDCDKNIFDCEQCGYKGSNKIKANHNCIKYLKEIIMS